MPCLPACLRPEIYRAGPPRLSKYQLRTDYGMGPLIFVIIYFVNLGPIPQVINPIVWRAMTISSLACTICTLNAFIQASW